MGFTNMDALDIDLGDDAGEEGGAGGVSLRSTVDSRGLTE
jgi:hypothetical protein